MSKTNLISLIVIFVISVILLIPQSRNYIKNTANMINDKMSDSMVVENYKAQYNELHDKKVQLTKNLQDFVVNSKVNEKKLTYERAVCDKYKKMLVEFAEDDIKKFNIIKQQYTISQIKVSNFEAIQKSYAEGIVKIKTAISTIDNTMIKCRTNIDTIESKKVLVDCIKTINSTIDNIHGIGEDTNLAKSIERLDENYLRESTKLEINEELDSCCDGEVNITTVDEMRNYIEELKKE